MKYTPVLVGAAVGAGDALVSNSKSLSTHKYAHGIYKFGILAAGAMGEMFFGWNQNIDYGLMTAASTLIGQRVPAMFQTGQGGLKAIATYTAGSPIPDNPGAATYTAGSPIPDNPGAASYAAAKTGCSSCGALAKVRHAHAVPLAADAASNYGPRQQRPTGAG